ncbi:hypothetical protein [Pleionea sediminis]|uniref:hypothetical protein n=1 Tax=Pleionea sediminis TaxID=2569479 RepID=UPI001184B764|nr:hypothetical protein [Pleionea sediminis]
MATFDHKAVGQALQEVPIGDMLYGLCHNVVETQERLDQNSVKRLIELAENKLDLPDGNGGTNSVSILSLGMVPSFYHFSEANFHLKVDIKHEVGGKRKKSFAVDLNANYADGREEKISEYKKNKNKHSEMISNANGGYYSRYYSKRSGNEVDFISKRVEIPSTVKEVAGGNFQHSIQGVYLSQEQVNNFNYAHEGQLWRPRIIVETPEGSVHLCILNLDTDGNIDGNSLSGGNAITLRTDTADNPQSKWPVIESSSNAPLVAYIEDPEDATTAIPIQYKVNVMTRTKDNGVAVPSTERHFGIVCFTKDGVFDAVNGVLSNVPASEKVDEGTDDYYTDSQGAKEITNAGPGDQSAIPGTKGGMLDVGRGYHPEVANKITVDCVSPTNKHQYEEIINSVPSDEDMSKHKPDVETLADNYGQLKLVVKPFPKGHRKEGKPNHGCFYQQLDVTGDTPFFTQLPQPRSVTPKKPDWITEGEKLESQQAEYQDNVNSSSNSGSSVEENSRDVVDADNRFSAGITGSMSVSDSRKYNFEMSATSSIDAKLVTIPAPAGLVDKLLDNL